MVANMKVGTMDAFCVGEPWNAQLVNQGIGYTAVNTGEIWNEASRKSPSPCAPTGWRRTRTRAQGAPHGDHGSRSNGATTWPTRKSSPQIVGKRQWFNVPPQRHRRPPQGRIDYGNGRVVENSPHLMKFWRDHASYPFQSHDTWFLTEDIRWGKFAPDTDIKALIAKVNREDIWREAAKDLGVAAADIPASTSRGIETFFDGKVFDPANPAAYLASLAIKRVA